MGIFCFNDDDYDYYVAAVTVEEAIDLLKGHGVVVTKEDNYNECKVVIAFSATRSAMRVGKKPQ